MRMEVLICTPANFKRKRPELQAVGISSDVKQSDPPRKKSRKFYTKDINNEVAPPPPRKRKIQRPVQSQLGEAPAGRTYKRKKRTPSETCSADETCSGDDLEADRELQIVRVHVVL
jgi:hypothetical protein